MEKKVTETTVLGTSHNLSRRGVGGGGGEIDFYPKLFPDPY